MDDIASAWFDCHWYNLYKFMDTILIYVFMAMPPVLWAIFYPSMLCQKYRSKITRKIGSKMKLFMSRQLMSYQFNLVWKFCAQIIKLLNIVCIITLAHMPFDYRFTRAFVDDQISPLAISLCSYFTVASTCYR